MRIFLLLVLGLPMLMPPGMCVCQFAPCVGAESNSTPAFEPRSASEPTEGKRCCCDRRLKAERDEASRPDDPKPAPGRLPLHDNQPADHGPNCPVVTGGSLVTAVLPVVALHLAFADVGIYTSLPTARAVRAVLSDRLSSYGTSPPVYLAHCSLVI